MLTSITVVSYLPGRMSHSQLEKPLSSISAQAVLDTLVENPRAWARKASLRQSVDKIHDAYSGKKLSTVGGYVEYDDAINQAAYMFLYFPNHCQATNYGLTAMFCNGLFGNIHLQSLLALGRTHRTINVCSVGGGPGTDVLGLAMMLKTLHAPYSLYACVLDHYPQWSAMWGKIKRQINIRCAINFLKYELRDRLTNQHIEEARNAHMFMFIKFISAVRAIPQSRIAIRTMLMCAMPGAYIFYADNQAGGGNIHFFREIAREAGFYVVSQFSSHLPSSCHSLQDAHIYSLLNLLFQSRTQRSIKMNFMMMKKRETRNVYPLHPGARSVTSQMIRRY